MDNPRVPRYRVALVRETSLNVEIPNQVNNADEIALIFRELFMELDREQLAAATLDNKNKVIGLNVVHMGSISSTVAHPREIMKLAVLQNAASVVTAHNHPSGDPWPSAEDRDMHKRMKEVGNVMAIRYLDSLVIGDHSYYSFNLGGEQQFIT